MLVESLGIGLLGVSVVLGFFILTGSKKKERAFNGKAVCRKHR